MSDQNLNSRMSSPAGANWFLLLLPSHVTSYSPLISVISNTVSFISHFLRISSSLFVTHLPLTLSLLSPPLFVNPSFCYLSLSFLSLPLSINPSLFYFPFTLSYLSPSLYYYPFYFLYPPVSFIYLPLSLFLSLPLSHICLPLSLISTSLPVPLFSLFLNLSYHLLSLLLSLILPFIF